MDSLTSEYYRPAALTGVLYAEDFDEPPPGREAPEIIAPGYSADDVDLAREEGHAAGLEEARAEHTTIHSALCSAALTAIGDAIARGRADAAEVGRQMAEEIAGTLLALLRAALPATAARLAADEIAALLAILLPPLSQAPCVTVRVHPSLLSSVAEQLESFPGVSASGDPKLAPSDVTVAWEDGHARRDWTTLWRQITTALAPFGLPADIADLPPIAEGHAHGDRT
jgi:flagellar biosynthesis/type III secretory pathway protein FliH